MASTLYSHIQVLQVADQESTRLRKPKSLSRAIARLIRDERTIRVGVFLFEAAVMAAVALFLIVFFV